MLFLVKPHNFLIIKNMTNTAQTLQEMQARLLKNIQTLKIINQRLGEILGEVRDGKQAAIIQHQDKSLTEEESFIAEMDDIELCLLEYLSQLRTMNIQQYSPTQRLNRHQQMKLGKTLQGIDRQRYRFLKLIDAAEDYIKQNSSPKPETQYKRANTLCERITQFRQLLEDSEISYLHGKTLLQAQTSLEACQSECTASERTTLLEANSNKQPKANPSRMTANFSTIKKLSMKLNFFCGYCCGNRSYADEPREQNKPLSP
ncbi:MAG: hypothetical protein K0S08_1412 [Gammaproteobacteria bacterium]|jgi:hypothetical protein|nr:hypothetical protein [Gammaproteobacteria bacterium]